MDSPYDFGPIASTDLAKLQRVVKKRSNHLLHREDIEDIAATILLDAVVASRKSGTPVIKLAFTYATYTRYYSRPSDALSADLANRVALPETQDDDEGQNPIPEIAVPSDFTEVVAIGDLVSRLPADERETLIFHAMEGGTLDEFVLATNAPRSTAHRRLAHSRQQFMELWLAA